MISERTCDTDDCYYITGIHSILKCIKIENGYFKIIIFHNFLVFLIIYQYQILNGTVHIFLNLNPMKFSSYFIPENTKQCHVYEFDCHFA